MKNILLLAYDLQLLKSSLRIGAFSVKDTGESFIVMSGKIVA